MAARDSSQDNSEMGRYVFFQDSCAQAIQTQVHRDFCTPFAFLCHCLLHLYQATAHPSTYKDD